MIRRSEERSWSVIVCGLCCHMGSLLVTQIAFGIQCSFKLFHINGSSERKIFYNVVPGRWQPDKYQYWKNTILNFKPHVIKSLEFGLLVCDKSSQMSSRCLFRKLIRD